MRLCTTAGGLVYNAPSSTNPRDITAGAPRMEGSRHSIYIAEYTYTKHDKISINWINMERDEITECRKYNLHTRKVRRKDAVA